jgi:PKD repeat protein
LVNSPPRLSLGGPSAWQVFRAGTVVPLAAAVSDASNDVLTCSVGWDDGTQESYPAAAAGCNRTHTFASAGMYTVDLTVSDDDGGVVSASVIIVVYDPAGGYPTAGGWLEPEPEITSSASATGKATFQFNPKYLPGDTGPVPGTGKVAFRFPAASFRLDSTALEWLVVTTDGKAAVKGTATVNGATGYGFVLYAYDDPDKLRLVVWSLAQGPVPGSDVVYDNVPGAAFDVDAANPQPIAHGAITIHR